VVEVAVHGPHRLGPRLGAAALALVVAWCTLTTTEGFERTAPEITPAFT